MRELSDYEIIQICKRYHIKLNNIYSRDQLPKSLSNGFYIFNLDKRSGAGSHWISACISDHGNFYFDSFGFPPFQEFVNRVKKFEYNKKEIQDERSDSCGWFCMMFLYYMQTNGNNKRSFDEFISLFTDKPALNEKILENFFENKF